jgi:hypothetical protein
VVPYTWQKTAYRGPMLMAGDTSVESTDVVYDVDVVSVALR